MSKEKIFEDLKEAIIQTDEDRAVKAANVLVSQGMDPRRACRPEW